PSNNRIALEGALALALGLKGNKNLRKLKMSRNPIQNEGCLGILKAIRVNPGAAMELLDFSVGQACRQEDKGNNEFVKLLQLHRLRERKGGPGSEVVCIFFFHEAFSPPQFPSGLPSE
uniref:Uncharacterized protein n=1 Tax=Pseudonaja textilis TaxID=8673 RepID=A0A670Z569_PSETE